MRPFLLTVVFGFGCFVGRSSAQEHLLPAAPEPARLSIEPQKEEPKQPAPSGIPLPAHAAPPKNMDTSPRFRVASSKLAETTAPKEVEPPPADYLLPDRDTKPPITPESANLNLPQDLEVTSPQTGEVILLPAGTYRQILQLPIDSPLMQGTDRIREDRSLPTKPKTSPSKYAEPERKPVWVRYESLEKIKIAGEERRGGIDIPAQGPAGLGPRVWYAKSETADVASSVFYFIFGGLGYSTANMLGWSAGNTRDIPGDFEYRLIRR